MKYPNGYILKPEEEQIIVQEITLANNCEKEWPADTHLMLTDFMSDLMISEHIFIGRLVAGAQAKISMRLDVGKSALKRHAFAYQLCYGTNGTIG